MIIHHFHTDGTEIILTLAEANLLNTAGIVTGLNFSGGWMAWGNYTGAVPGKEVVQLYVTAPGGRMPRPAQELKGYVKTGVIEPGGSESVDITFDFEDLAAYDETVPGWVLEAGDYVLRLGSSSRDNEPAAVLCLDESVTTLKTKKLFID